MQFVHDVLNELHASLDARIVESNEALEQDSAVLAYLRRCVAEQAQYVSAKARIAKNVLSSSSSSLSSSPVIHDASEEGDECQGYHAESKSSILKFASFDEGLAEDRHEDGDESYSGNRNIGARARATDRDTHENHIEADAKPPPPTSLEDILRHAKQLREAHSQPIAKPPGADGSRLGGSAGRNSASSHSSTHSLQIARSSSGTAARGSKVVAGGSTAVNRYSTKAAVKDISTTGGGTKVVAGGSTAVNRYSTKAGVKDTPTTGVGAKAKLIPNKAEAKNSSAQSRAAMSDDKIVRPNRSSTIITDSSESSTATNKRSLPPPSNPFTQSLVAQVELLSKPTARKYWESKLPTKDVALATVPSSELIESQAVLLTQLAGYPSMPPSIAFEAVRSQRMNRIDAKNNTDIKVGVACEGDEEEEVIIAQAKRDCYAAANASRSARDEYQKHWRHRLKRTPVSCLNISERQQLVSIWYRLHSCAKVYEAAQLRLRRLRQVPSIAATAAATAAAGGLHSKQRQHSFQDSGEHDIENRGGGSASITSNRKEEDADDTDVAKIRTLLRDLIHSFPQRAPVPAPPVHGLPASQGHGHLHSQANMERRQAQLQEKAQTQLRTEFHDALKSRIQYVIEAAVGGFLLRDVVRCLRHCCEQKMAAPGTGAGAEAEAAGCSVEQWQEALRSYRALHTCLLTDGASDPSSCMFMHKP